MSAPRSDGKKETGLRCIVVETVANRQPRSYKSLYWKLGAGFCIAFMFLFYSHEAALITLCAMLSSFVASNWWLFVIAGALFYVGLSMDERNRSTRGLLRITKVDTKGIVMGRPGMGHRDTTFFIPWNMLTCVETGIDETGKEPHEYMLFRMGAYLAYKLRRDIGFNWIDEQTVMTRARQYAPNAKYLIERSALDVRRPDSRYTNIWLQYLSPAGKRERRGHLQAGDMLNGGRFEILKVLRAGGQGTAYLAKTLDGVRSR